MDAAPATRRSLWSAPRWLPKGWPDFFLQLALFTIVDVLYELTRGLSEGSVATAFGHARRVVSWEQSLGIFNELESSSGRSSATGRSTSPTSRTSTCTSS